MTNELTSGRDDAGEHDDDADDDDDVPLKYCKCFYRDCWRCINSDCCWWWLPRCCLWCWCWCDWRSWRCEIPLPTACRTVFHFSSPYSAIAAGVHSWWLPSIECHNLLNSIRPHHVIFMIRGKGGAEVALHAAAPRNPSSALRVGIEALFWAMWLREKYLVAAVVTVQRFGFQEDRYKLFSHNFKLHLNQKPHQIGL